MPRCLALLICGLLGAGPLQAQIPADSTAAASPDTTRTEVDSLRVRVDSTAAPAPPLGLPPAEPGTVRDTTVLARTRFADLAALLSTWPGTWRYTLGTPGWADGHAPYGYAPQAPGLTLDGLPFDDLLDGRPRLDLLPLELLDPVREAGTHLGRPATVHTATRAYRGLPPYTELRYHKGRHGLQFISGMHVQERRRTLFGQPGRVQVLFRYGGRGTTNEYPNSEAHTRQVYGRLRFESSRWLMTLSNHYAQFKGGAHGGVQQRAGLDFSSVYIRFGASVRLPRAQRTLKRNHLALALRLRGLERLAPLSTAVYWTTQISRYTETDTLSTRAHRLGVHLRQPVPNMLPGHQFLVRLDAWTDRIQESTVWTDTLPEARSQWHLSLHDAFAVGPIAATAEAGWHRVAGESFTALEGRVETGPGNRQVFAEAYTTGRTPAWLETTGYGGTVQPVTAPLRAGRLTFGRLGLTLRAGPWDATVFGFARQTAQPVDLYATASTDTVQYIQSPEALRWTGAGADLGWRRHTLRGLYATLQPGLFVLPTTDTPERARISESLPRWTLQGRVGARFRVFNELDVDAFVRGHYWAAHRSRWYHPPTGLFVIPQATDPEFGPSGTLDAHLEADLRGARLFLSLENALAGLSYAGTLVVPVYPLPERLLRFGVYWPILN